MNIQKQLLKNTLIIFLGKIFNQMLSFFLLPLYTSLLSTDDYGMTDVILTLGSLLAPVIILQLDAGLFRMLIEKREDKTESKTATESVFVFSFFLIVCFNLLYLPVASALDVKYSMSILLYIDTSAILNLVLQYYRGIGNNMFYSFLCCWNGLVTISCNIVFITVLKLGAFGMISAYIVGGLSTTLIGMVLIWKQNHQITSRFNFCEIKKILKYSIPLIFNGVSWWIMNLSDRLVILGFLGASYNGIYAVSNRFSSVFFSAYSIFNMAWTETVARGVTRGAIPEEIKRTNEGICEGLLYLAAGIIASMYWIYPLLIGDNYSEGYLYIPILVIAVYFNCLAAQLGGILVALKDSKTIALTSICGAVVNIFLNLLFINLLELYAAALSTLVAYVVMFVMRYITVGRRMMKIKRWKYLVPSGLVFSSILVYYIKNCWFLSVNLLIVIGIIGLRYRKELKRISIYIRKIVVR